MVFDVSSIPRFITSRIHQARVQQRRSSISISAPSNVRTFRHDLDENTPPCQDDDDKSSSGELQRHSEGPGFQVVSDLDLEGPRGYEYDGLPPVAPYLILAGDIGRFCDGGYTAFLRSMCQRYQRLFLVAGNHEFYGSSFDEGMATAKRIQEELGEKFTFLDRDVRFELEGGETIMVGCTLHSNIPSDLHLFTQDFESIQGWSRERHNAQHILDCEWLIRALAEAKASQVVKRIIVVTHYAPTFERTTNPRHRGSPSQYSFCSEVIDAVLESAGGDLISHWVFGHTHYNTRFTRMGTVVISNQPYDSECNRKFDLEATI